jgi:hypothetical protein
MAGHFLALTTFFAQPPHEAVALAESIFDTHGGSRADARANLPSASIMKNAELFALSPYRAGHLHKYQRFTIKLSR